MCQHAWSSVEAPARPILTGVSFSEAPPRAASPSLGILGRHLPGSCCIPQPPRQPAQFGGNL